VLDLLAAVLALALALAPALELAELPLPPLLRTPPKPAATPAGAGLLEADLAAAAYCSIVVLELWAQRSAWGLSWLEMREHSRRVDNANHTSLAMAG